MEQKNLELFQKNPALYCTIPSEKCSKKYSFVSTEKIIDYLAKNNWYPVSAKTSGLDKMTGVHQVNFQNQNYNFGDFKSEIILINSHNTKIAFQLFSGIKVQICSNGLMIPLTQEESFKQKHINIDYENFSRILKARISNFETNNNKINYYKTIELQEVEKNFFAVMARNERFKDNNNVTPQHILQTHRVENENNDTLWNVFNVIQENCIKGGFKYSIKNESGKSENKTARPLNNIYDNKKINMFLWSLMARMATNKTGIV